MRHSYATWLLEAGADIRWVRDQKGHASIGETEGTYGHLVREHHERDVDALDVAFQAAMAPGDNVGTRTSLDSRRPAASHCVPPAAGQPLSVDQRDEELMVEGKGFEPVCYLSISRHDQRGVAKSRCEPIRVRVTISVTTGKDISGTKAHPTAPPVAKFVPEV